MRSFLGFRNFYRTFIPYRTAKFQGVQELLRKKLILLLETKTLKQALADAKALAATNQKGIFRLDTDTSAVAKAGVLHKEQDHKRKTIL